jgi:hypothetical protein
MDSQSLRMVIEISEQYTASFIVCVEEAASHADKAVESIQVTQNIFQEIPPPQRQNR